MIRIDPHGRRAADPGDGAPRRVALLGVMVALAACVEAAPQQDTPAAPRPIAWERVEAFDGQSYRTLSGIVGAIQHAPLSFEVGGQIREIRVETGDHFAAGDVLAVLDDRTYRLALDERRAALAEARAWLTEASATFDRQRELHENGWVARAAYDQALAALESARSRVETAASRVAIAEDQVSDTALTAPYAGTVAVRLAEPSQQVAPGQTVMEIQGNGGGMEVAAAVPETLVDRLTVGTRHRVTLPSRAGQTIDAILTEIGSEATAANAFPVMLTLLDAPADLRAGLTAEVTFALGDRQVASALIPVTAFLPGPDGRQLAYVFDPDSGTVRQRAITVVDIVGDRALVGEGLDPGAVVASRGVAFLSDGQPVTLLGDGAVRFNP